MTVSGAVRRPRVLEIACGAPLEQVLEAAGGPSEPLRAVLVGGYHGVWIAARGRPAGVRSTTQDLARHGGSLAAGVVVALGESACPAQELARAMRLAGRGRAPTSAGRARNGLPAIAGLLEDMVGRAAARGRPASCSSAGAATCPAAARATCPTAPCASCAAACACSPTEVADHERHGPCDACLRPAHARRPAAAAEAPHEPRTCGSTRSPARATGCARSCCPSGSSSTTGAIRSSSHGPLPDELLDHARRAVEACPKLALVLAERSPR